MTQIELFHIPGACSRASHVALEMTGAPFKVTVVPFHKGGLQTPEYKALSPAGQVPLLLVDGRPITETTAILFTIARLFPDAGVLPTGDILSEARAISRLAFCSSGLHPIVGRIVNPQHVCDLSPEAQARIQDQARQAMVDKLKVVEGFLSDTPWLLGESFTAADAYLCWVTGRMRLLGADFSSLPNTSGHVDRVVAQPAYQTILQREALYLGQLEADGAVYPPAIRSTLLAA